MRGCGEKRLRLQAACRQTRTAPLETCPRRHNLCGGGGGRHRGGAQRRDASRRGGGTVEVARFIWNQSGSRHLTCAFLPGGAGSRKNASEAASQPLRAAAKYAGCGIPSLSLPWILVHLLSTTLLFHANRLRRLHSSRPRWKRRGLSLTSTQHQSKPCLSRRPPLS